MFSKLLSRAVGRRNFSLTQSTDNATKQMIENVGPTLRRSHKPFRG